MSRAASVEDVAEGLNRRLTALPTLTFPEDWTLTDSWHRAQRASANVGTHNPAEWGMVLGHPDSVDPGGYHRLLFAVFRGQLVAECDCDGYRYRGWCAHVAWMWWAWVRSRVVVADLDTGRRYESPPWWLTVEEEGEP